MENTENEWNDNMMIHFFGFLFISLKEANTIEIDEKFREICFFPEYTVHVHLFVSMPMEQFHMTHWNLECRPGISRNEKKAAECTVKGRRREQRRRMRVKML